MLDVFTGRPREPVHVTLVRPELVVEVDADPTPGSRMKPPLLRNVNAAQDS
ncbi:hypothetical protein [Streptomyces sp. NK08204]|uniref:hypothetical protein n=1 Tax=Streptomyces sp. NK08204 TaxID=2873260 RepID=UPI001CEC70E3|nr:hypothetical protein [Streptomyces sp. NK08204]